MGEQFMKLLGGVVPLVSWHPSDYRDSNTAHQVSTNETQLIGCIPFVFFHTLSWIML